MTENLKMKAWGIFPVTKKQFLIIETMFFVFFIALAAFLFIVEIPEHIEAPIAKFHLKFTKYISLATAFLIIFEAQFFLNRFVIHQLKIIQGQKIQIEQQRDKIFAQKKGLTDGIKYARRIQTALLPKVDTISGISDYFI